VRCVCAAYGGAVWECDLDGARALSFVRAYCIHEYVISRGSCVEDEAMGSYGWGTVAWLCTVASVSLFLTDRPCLSRLGFSHLAATEIVLPGCFIVVSRLLGSASFAVVVRSYEISMTPTVSFRIEWRSSSLEWCAGIWLRCVARLRCVLQCCYQGFHFRHLLSQCSDDCPIVFFILSIVGYQIAEILGQFLHLFNC
jgi:hypothetical protein